MILINTVENNSSRYSNCDYSQAKISRKLQRTIGRPSYKNYQTIVNNKRLKNCPLMVEDVKAAEHIFGPETRWLTGKTVNRTGIAMRTNLMNLPFEILERYRSVTLSGDIMWINVIRFFKTQSCHIRFITSQAVRSATASSLGGYIKKVAVVYMQQSSRIVEMQMYGQFEPLRGALAEMKITMNVCSEAEHIGDIKRMNRTVKECARRIVFR